MSSRSFSQVLPFSANDLFDMVLDVEKYSQFVPHCDGVNIVKSGADVIVADTFISFFLIKTYTMSYRCNIFFDRNAYEISIQNADESTLKILYTKWKFIPAAKGTSVMLDVSVEISNKIANFVASAMFHKVSQDIMEAFKNRAYKILKSDNAN